MNGKDSTSVSPAEARSAAISRSRRCPAVSPVPARGLRQHRRDGVVPLQPGHLLDQVGRPGEVGSPARRDDGQRVPGGPSVTEQPTCCRRRAITAGSYGRPVSRSGSPSGNSMTVCGNGFPATSERPTITAAAVPDQQLGGRLGGDHRHPGVDGPLEAPGRLARQPVATRRPGDDGRLPVGRLDHHSRCAGTDLGGFTTHHAGQRDGPGFVGDDQIVGDQGALDAVQRQQCLALDGPADRDRAGQLARRRRRAAAGPRSSIT